MKRTAPNDPGKHPMVGHDALTDLVLSWDASCLATDTDFAIYEGSLGDFTSHEPRFCDTGGLTTITFAPGTGDRYYLVTPRNADNDGSYNYGTHV